MSIRIHALCDSPRGPYVPHRDRPRPLSHLKNPSATVAQRLAEHVDGRFVPEVDAAWRIRYVVVRGDLRLEVRELGPMREREVAARVAELAAAFA
jgi:hypothetical protein